MPQAKFLQRSIIDLNIGTYLGVEVGIFYTKNSYSFLTKIKFKFKRKDLKNAIH